MSRVILHFFQRKGVMQYDFKRKGKRNLQKQSSDSFWERGSQVCALAIASEKPKDFPKPEEKERENKKWLSMKCMISCATMREWARKRSGLPADCADRIPKPWNGFSTTSRGGTLLRASWKRLRESKISLLLFRKTARTGKFWKSARFFCPGAMRRILQKFEDCFSSIWY